MNLSSTNHSSNYCKRRGAARRGISLFEVLISILVASIGVFGVLVLIPFAVKNAQVGIDRESAITIAKNYYADFQAYGYHSPIAWVDDDTTLPVQPPDLDPGGNHDPLPDLVFGPVPFTNNIRKGFPYVVDVISTATAATQSPPNNQYGQFPSFTGLPTDFPQINRVNLMSNKPSTAPPILPMSIGLARRFAMPQDVLRFDAPATELGPPQQLYLQLDSQPNVKRQYNGKYTAVAFVDPQDDEARQYKLHVLALGLDDRNEPRVFEVATLPKVDTGNPTTREYENMALGGGDLVLTEITPTLPTEGQDEIRNSDWIMLINFYKPFTSTGLDLGYYDDIQFEFYRVVHASKTSDAGVSPRVYGVTLQGPDFDLFRDWAARASDGSTPAVGDPTQVKTYAVLIPNVLTVYQRSFRVEPNSNWSYD